MERKIRTLRAGSLGCLPEGERGDNRGEQHLEEWTSVLKHVSKLMARFATEEEKTRKFSQPSSNKKKSKSASGRNRAAAH